MLKIVVGYDFTSLADDALARAALLGGRFSPVEIHVLSVVDKSLQQRGLVQAIDVQGADQIRTRLAAIVDQVPTTHEMHEADLFARVRIGKADAEILDLAEEISADLIVVGTHGHTGASRLLLGSVAESVVRQAGCPVLVSRSKSYPAAERDPRYLPEPAGGAVMDHRLEPHIYRYRPGIAPRRPAAWTLY